MERKAADSIGLPPEETVIFDLERTPISSRAEYVKKDFYNKFAPSNSREHSILELLPHLGNSHTLTLSEEISRLYIFLPYDFIVSTINKMLREKDTAKTYSESEIDGFV